MGADLVRVFVMRGERMPVGHKKQALVLALQAHPVLEHPVIVAQVQDTGGPHARQDALGIHKGSILSVRPASPDWRRAIGQGWGKANITATLGGAVKVAPSRGV